MRGRTLLIAWLASGAALAGVLGAAATLAIETAPAVPALARVSAADVERALRLARAHDPRRQRPHVVRALFADEHDLALLLHHAAARWAGAGTRLRLDAGRAEVRASVPLRGTSRWLNVDLVLRQARGLPEVESLRVGALPLPAWAAEPLLAAWLERRGFGVDMQLPRDVVRHVEFRRGRLVLFYAWREDTLSRMLATLVPAPDQLRLRAYSDHLVELLRDERPGAAVSLARLLPPVFALARERSASGDPARENRAALLALAFYANQRGLGAIVPAARQWPRPTPLVVTLGGRVDLPLHVLISAVIAAEAGSPLADAVGLYKEISDARNGSGFSFGDLVADRAGTRLGERAAREPVVLQDRLAAGITESDLLPDLGELPEPLRAAEFARRFGQVGAPAYLLMMREVEERLDALPLLK